MFMIVCIFEILSSFLCFLQQEFQKVSFTSSQNVTKNRFISVSFPGDLSFCILTKVINSSFATSSFSGSLICAFFVFLIERCLEKR